MMFGNVYIKLFIGCAIVWQLFSLFHYNDLIATSGTRELMLEPEGTQRRDSSPRIIHAQSENDADIVLGKMSAAIDSNQEWRPKNQQSPQNATELPPSQTTKNTTIPITDPQPILHTTTTMPSIRNECFALNSDKWINGNIASNNAEGITAELLDTLLEGPRSLQGLSSLFDQTICHEDSPLRNFSPKRDDNDDDDDESRNRLALAEDWYQRFLYLALHWKFHRPALREHQSRKRCAQKDATEGRVSLQSFMEEHKIQTMDFECRGEKFVVVPIASIGFGAFLNTQASLSILLALKNNRIPIFSSKSFFPWQKRKGDRDPWLLAPSHCNRKDLQCYFLPLSPCTITQEDLDAAPIYGSDRKEQKFLGKNLTIPPELESQRIVVVNSGLAEKTKDTADMREIASTAIQELLEQWKNDQIKDGHLLSDKDLEAIELAHEWLTEKIKDDPIGLLRQVYVYMLRPNPHYKDLLRRQMSALVPRAINPSETIGMAIRGSDKCKSESMCLPFDRYMELATDVAYPTLSLPRNINSISPVRPKLIMTTEDPQVFNNSLVYQNNISFPFEILVNDNDNMQGSGYPREFSGEAENTIVSSLTALQFHFNAGRVYLNCCSNFHLVLNYLIQGQCGSRRHGHNFVFGIDKDSKAASSHHPPPVAQCLSEEGMPRRFRICCGWSKKNGVCGEIWKEYLEEKEENNLLVKNEFGSIAISK